MVTSNRVSCVDTLRGVAIILMVIFHFCYDLQYFKIYNFHITSNPFFLNFRVLIVTLFLFIVGVSLYLSHQETIRWHRVKKRVFVLFGVALLISLVTYFIFPRTWIYFGIIHFIALASLFGLFFLRQRVVAFIIGVGVIVLYNLGFISMHPLFSYIAPKIGLPLYHTEDLVPFIPWFGVVLVGIALSSSFVYFCQKKKIEAFFRKLSLLNFLGRHALLIYLLHQVILFALFFVILSIIP